MLKKIMSLIPTLSVLPLLSDPNPPSNLLLEPSFTTVLLKWNGNNLTESGYKIYRDDKFIALLDKNTTSFIDKNLTQNTTYTYTIKATDDNLNAPYTLPIFKTPLEKVKLQWQSSDTDEYKTISNFDGVFNEYFYLSDNSIVNLKTQNIGNKRVEFRQKESWDTEVGSKIVADLKCNYPEYVKEYTWMQLFDEGTNQPILRLIWRKLKDKKDNHLWAFFKGNTKEIKIDLGSNPDTFFNAVIDVHEKRVEVIINNQVLLDENVSHWIGKNYFKTGVYLSGSINDNNESNDTNKSAALVQFKSLSFE